MSGAGGVRCLAIGPPAPLADLAPGWLSGRLPAPRGLEIRRGRWIAASIVLGAVSHVVWDTFTHRNRWGTNQILALNQDIGGLPLYKWLQFGSGALGLVVLAWWVFGWVRRTTARPAVRVSTRKLRRAAWSLVAGVVLGAVALVSAYEVAVGSSLESLAFRVVTTAITAASAVTLGVCMVWHAAVRRATPPSAP